MRFGCATILALAAGAAALGMALAGRQEARSPPVIARYALTAPPGACASRPVRLAVIGDLHVSARTTPPSTVAEVVRRANLLSPDHVLLVGDYLGDGWPRDPAAIRRALAPLAGLRPRGATVAVLGNNDWQDGPDAIAATLSALGVHVLRNDALVTRDVAFLGVEEIISNTANPRLAEERLAAALAASRRAPPPLSIWLAHQPDMFRRMEATGTLLVTGHSHGGQILPGITVPLLRAVTRADGAWAGWPARNHVRGLYEQGGKRMLVTSGIGVSGPPLRLGVPPEIALVEVAPCRAVSADRRRPPPDRAAPAPR